MNDGWKIDPSKRALIGALAGVTAGTLAAWPRAARAQGARTLTIIVPQPAGNPSDVFIRKMQPILQRELDQPIVVENLPGAGGSIGINKLLNAPADGSMATVVSQTEPILTPLALSAARYQPEAMRPIGLFGRTSYALAGRPTLEAATLTELIAQGRRMKDKPLTYGHIGNGSMIHLLGEQWARKCELPVVHVPYKGVPPLVQDLTGGQIDLSFIPLGGSSLSLLETGKLRVYGVTAAQPAAALPKAAPLSAQDPALRDFVYGTWGMVLLPRATPDAALQRWNKAFAAAISDADVLAFLRSNGTDPQAPLSLAALDEVYRQETQLYQQLARSIGIKPE